MTAAYEHCGHPPVPGPPRQSSLKPVGDGICDVASHSGVKRQAFSIYRGRFTIPYKFIITRYILISLVLSTSNADAGPKTSVRCLAKGGDQTNIAVDGEDILREAHRLGFKRKFGKNKSFGNTIELTPSWKTIRFRNGRPDEYHNLEGICDIQYLGTPTSPIYIE